jgi:MazG family protein
VTDAQDWSDVDHGALARQLGVARAADAPQDVTAFSELLGIVHRLRDEDGCPWDRKQTLSSMAKNLLEEAYETQEAIAADDHGHTAEELGDTLLNVLLMTRIAEQDGRFGLAEVARGIAEKLVRRHPHVFGPRQAADADEALVAWNESKAREAGKAGPVGSVLDEVKSGQPPLVVARKLGKRAATVGFDWPDVEGALDKLKEEVGELEQVLSENARPPLSETALRRAEDELGDVLFSAVNVGRKLGIDPELALSRTLAKFRRRFAAVERELGDSLPNAGLAAMEAAWRRAAQAEES